MSPGRQTGPAPATDVDPQGTREGPVPDADLDPVKILVGQLEMAVHTAAGLKSTKEGNATWDPVYMALVGQLSYTKAHVPPEE